MPNYRYAPYYKYNGPTHSQPLREELSAEEAARRIGLFFEEISSHFIDANAQIESVDTDVVSITVELTESECDERVKRFLNSLDLFAKKIDQRKP